jgi:hypothetical protein
MLTGLAVVGSMAFPPAMVLLPVLAALPIGRDGDLSSPWTARVFRMFLILKMTYAMHARRNPLPDNRPRRRTTAGTSAHPGNCTLGKGNHFGGARDCVMATN